MYSRRALFLACIALVLANVQSAKIPSSPTALLKKRAPPMGPSQRLNPSPITTTTTATNTIRYVGYYIDAD